MTMKFSTLKKQAQSSTSFRGHKMKWSEKYPNYAECRKCGAWVQVMENPPPNDINIGGPAVAIHCGDNWKNR